LTKNKASAVAMMDFKKDDRPAARIRVAMYEADAAGHAGADLTHHIRTIHAGSHGTNGAPRVHSELKIIMLIRKIWQFL
jgi:hypothetical protein